MHLLLFGVAMQRSPRGQLSSTNIACTSTNFNAIVATIERRYPINNQFHSRPPLHFRRDIPHFVLETFYADLTCWRAVPLVCMIACGQACCASAARRLEQAAQGVADSATPVSNCDHRYKRIGRDTTTLRKRLSSPRGGSAEPRSQPSMLQMMQAVDQPRCNILLTAHAAHQRCRS